MDSKPHVSLSTTRVYPHERALSSSPGSLPIRAPPTLDDSDFETSIKINGHKLNNIYSNSSCSSFSDSGFESDEGFVSGEEEFATASQRPFVAYPDEETLEESGVVEKYVLSRPFVADLHEESGVEEYVLYKPFVDDPDEESLGTPMEEEEESGGLDYAYLNQVMPIAQLSREGDDDNDVVSDEELKSELEDGGFLGPVRVPGIGDVQNSDGVPKIKVLELEEGEVDFSLLCRSSSSVVNQSETSLKAKGVEGLVNCKIVEVGSGIYSDEGDQSAVKEFLINSVSAKLIEDKGPGVTEEAQVESLMAKDENVVVVNSKLDEDVLNSIEKMRVLDELEKEGIALNDRNINVNSTAERGSIIGVVETSEAVEGSTNLVNGTDIVSFVVEEPVEFSTVDVNDIAILDQCSDINKLEHKIGFEADLRDVSHHATAANVVEDLYNAVERNGIHSEFSEPRPDQRIKYLGNGDLPKTVESDRLEDELYSKCIENKIPSSTLDLEIQLDKEDEAKHSFDEVEEENSSLLDEGAECLIFGNSDTAKLIMNELAQRLAPASLSHAESSQDHSPRIDGAIVMDIDKEVDTNGEGEGKELFDSAALTALLKAAASLGSDGGSVTITSGDGSRVYSVECPVGLGSSLCSLRPAHRPNHPNLFTPSELNPGNESEESLSEEEKKKMEKIQLIRVKFLRLIQRLGHSPEESIAGKVLNQLVVAAGRHFSQVFSLESAQRMAMKLEAECRDDLDFSLNILVLGKTGVGKSATINSIFGEEKATVDAFEPATTVVKEIVGEIDGVKIKVFDTPGLGSSVMEQAFNQKILLSIKKFMKKCPPDVILYVDRLDIQTRDLNDLPLLRSITSSLGSSIWQSAIVTLTHAAAALPDGPSGSPLSYEMFVAQQSDVVQQSISQAVSDCLKNPVSLVENHPFSRKNGDGEIVLPIGQSWRPQLLLLCYSIKILSEVSSILKHKDPLDHRKLFGFRVRSPPLASLLSSLWQFHAHPKLPADQGGENVDSDIELGDFSDSNKEDEDEYDQLPPFKPLRKSQLAKLSMVLPPSFDGDNAVYRYRFLEPTSQLLTRPVLGTNGWDHDCGYDGVSLEENLAIAGAILEVRLKEKDYPMGQDQSTLGLSLMKWRGELAIMANLQSQFSIGQSTKMAVRVGLNNKQSGQITVRTSSSNLLQIALIGIVPIAISIFRRIFRRIFPGSSGRNSTS